MAIRTNTNLTGLWFFTPLSFSFPFIFLYTYFLSEGILENKKNYLFSGLGIALILIVCHPLSVVFSLPIFAVLAAINYRSILKVKWFWLVFAIIAAVGIIFLALIFGEGPTGTLKNLVSFLSFAQGWGVLELNNSLFELYPWPAWLWAIIGVSYLLRRNSRPYSFYILWVFLLLGSTLLYRLIGVSFFSPFQRNLYYLTLALPILSGYGLHFFISKTLPSWLRTWPNHKNASLIISGTLVAVTVFTIFVGYYNLPRASRLYRALSQDDYATILFLAKEPQTMIMTPPFIGTALTALTNHEPVGAIAFYGNHQLAADFYRQPDCAARQKIIESTGAKIIYWPKTIKDPGCSWLKLLRQSQDSYLFTVIKT